MSVPEIVVSTGTFERQMGILASDFTVLSLERFAESLRAGQSLPGNAVIVTFDDGWKDNRRYAYPLLREHACPATIFVATDFIGTGRMFWHERYRFLLRAFRRTASGGAAASLMPGGDLGRDLHELAAARDPGRTIARMGLEAWKLTHEERTDRIRQLEELPGAPSFPAAENAFLDWDEIREMSEGGIRFGSHGQSHRPMTVLSPADLAGELEASRDRIGRETGHVPYALAYPKGEHNAAVCRAAADAGYKTGLTTLHGTNTSATDPYGLKRINVSETRFSDASGCFSDVLFRAALAGRV